MKTAKIYIVSAVAGVAILSTGCDKKASLNSDTEKASYSIGVQIGKSLQAQGADIAVPSLVMGINDGIGGKEPQLKPDEIQASMQKMQETVMKKQLEAADKNLKDGETWLEKNKSKEGVKTTESGLQYEVVQEGTGPSPKDSDFVKVHYTGTLISGEKFDSSIDRNEPAEFPVRGVIPGWTEALKMMKQGGKWKIAIPAKLAYGPSGRPGIPPNSTLLFDVELLEVKGAPAQEGAVAPAPQQPKKK